MNIRQKIAIRKSKDERENREQYQYIANQVRSRKYPSLTESLEKLRLEREQNPESSFQPIQDSGEIEENEPQIPQKELPIQLELFVDVHPALRFG